MMKAAQAPGVGGMPLSGNQGSHSPSHQNLHGGSLLAQNEPLYK